MLAFVALGAETPSKKNPRASSRPTSFAEKELRNLSAGFGIGTTWASYEQTDLSKVVQTNLTPKVELSYIVEPKEWNLEANGYVSLLAISNPSITGTGMKYYGGDLRLNYQARFKGTPWTLYFLGGVYFMGTFGTDNVGYKSVVGPEVYPAVKYTFENGATSSAYLKFAPILSGFSLLSLDNSLFAGGLSYFLKPIPEGIFQGVLLGLTFDASRLKLLIVGGEVVSTNYTFALNIIF